MMTQLRRFENLTMSSSRPPFAPATRGGLPGLLLLVVPLLLGADDQYLREIEDEARRQATTLITSPLQSTAPSAGARTDQLAAGLDQAAFEQALRQNLPGTFALYEQLDTSRKQQVYRIYQNNNQLAHISEQVAQLLGGKP